MLHSVTFDKTVIEIFTALWTRNLTKWLLVTNFVFSFFQNRRSLDCHMSVSNPWPQQCMKSILLGSLRSDMQQCELDCSLTSFHCSVGVDIATSHRLDCRGAGVRVPVRARFFSSPRRTDLSWGPHPASYPMSMVGSFLGVKWPHL
jgi:hypothetical protein